MRQQGRRIMHRGNAAFLYGSMAWVPDLIFLALLYFKRLLVPPNNPASKRKPDYQSGFRL
jgi:hypothetical protein